MDEGLIKHIKNDRFAKHAGIYLVEVGEGYAVAEVLIEDCHLNGVNIVQGGVIFTLADYAFAAASNSGGLVTVGIHSGISFFKAPVGKRLRAIAREQCLQKKICGYMVDVFDEDGSMVASLNAMGYRKQDR